MSIKQRLSFIKYNISYTISFSIGLTIYGLCRLASFAGRLMNSKIQMHREPNPIFAKGISVIIPERDNPSMLTDCLASLYRSLSLLDEPWQVIVVANGAPASIYKNVSEQFPNIDWVVSESPMGFSEAIAAGMQTAQYEWVFLLNNDMQLESDCLVQLIHHRAPNIFSLGCQIFLHDQNRRREETGLTGIRIEADDLHLFDREPYVDGVVEHLYSGGGASLFRASLLKQFIRSAGIYNPFYWEDVDWGVNASLLGFKNLFVSSAKVKHQHRATVSRFYTREQVESIFTRNKWIFYLRFGLRGVHPFWLGRRVRDYGLFNVSSMLTLMTGVYDVGATQEGLRDAFVYSNRDVLLPIQNAELPWMIFVVPFAIYPRAHGAAIRQHNIYTQLSQHFNIWLITDEADAYQGFDWKNSSPFSIVTLLKNVRKQSGNSRSERMSSHSHSVLRETLKQVLSEISPAVVQIEHEELSELIDLRKATRGKDEQCNWAITLHDVNLGVGDDASVADRRLLKALARYDAVFTCSPEDSAMLPIKNTCIENGVDPEKFHYKSVSQNKALIFVGPFRYAPNKEAMDRFLENLWQPLRDRFPDLTLYVLAGMDNSEALVSENILYQQAGIQFINSTNDVASFLDSSALMINPLQSIRGSCLKTIEALASGRVCVSLQDAARGLDQYSFAGLKVAKDWSEMLSLIELYLRDDQLRRTEEKPDMDKLQSFYWQSRACQQLKAYEKLGVGL